MASTRIGSRTPSPAEAKRSEGHPFLRQSALPGLLVLFCVPILLYGLASYSLVNGDEALYHGVAEAMAESGDWLSLRFRGNERFYDTFMNAPLHYWVRALLITTFGSNLWTTRILSALAGLGCVLATWRLGLLSAEGRTARPRMAAFLAGLTLLTTFQFVYLHSARTGELDTMVSLVLVCIALTFLRFLETGRGILLHHGLLALLLTLKLPLVAVPLLAELAIFAALRSGRPHFRRWLLFGLAVAPLALSWHIGNGIARWDDFLDVARAMADQATGAAAGTPQPEGRISFYGGVLLFGAFPISIAYPIALVTVLLQRGSGREARRALVVASFAASILGFQLLVAKRAPWYVIPAYPFLSVFVGLWLADLYERGLRRLEWGVVALLVALAIWLSVGATSYNPFVLPALNIPMEARWRSIDGIGAGWGLPLTALASVTMLLAAVRRFGRETVGRWVSVGLILALLGTAGARVLQPLRLLPYVSPLDQLSRDLDDLRATGLELRHPVEVPRGPLWIVVYSFGDEYEIRRVIRPDRPFAFQLVPKQAPAREP